MNLNNVVLCARHEIPGAVQIASSGHYIDIYFDSDQTQLNTDRAAAFAYDYGGHVAFSTGNHVALVFPEGRGRNPHKRVQISLKLEKDVDHDIITFLDTVENRQGLIKRLIREHMHNLTLLDIERGLSNGSDN